MAKPPGLCIFCGKGGLSKEHLFADWLRELFPRTPHDTRTQGETWFEASAGQWTSPLRRSFQGHTGSKKLRVVCTKCNNNWVSGIDDAVRNALVPLILGHAIVLDDTLQHKLATWITKVTIVAEYINPNNRAVSKEERLWFWGNRKPIGNWRIWITNYSGISWRWLHVYHHMIRFDSAAPKEVSSGSRNTHSTTIGMGNLLFHIMGTSVQDLTFELNDDEVSNLIRIWPIKQSQIRWPARGAIDDRGADYIANTLSRIAGHPDASLR